MQSPQFHVHAALEETHWWFTGRRQMLRDVVQGIAAPSSDVHILDVGCGTGGNTAEFAKDYSCIGIDPSTEGIHFARARFPAVRFLEGDVFADPEELKRADIVLLLDVIECIDDDFLFVSKLLAGMKPGAHLVIMVPNDKKLWGPHDKAFGHFRRYDRARFRRLWEDLPVTQRLLSCCNARLYPLVKILRGISRLRWKPLGKGDTDITQPPDPINGILRSILAGEGKRLRRALEGKGKGYVMGVSLLAVLRRENDSVTVRPKPEDIRDATPWMDAK